MESTTNYTFPVQTGGIFYVPWHRHQGRFRLLTRGDSPGSEKHASLENTLVGPYFLNRIQRNIIRFFVNSYDYNTCFMINLKCANYTTIELHELHKSFVSSNVHRCFYGSRELRMRAQYSYLSNGYDDPSPGDLPGTLTVFGSCPTNPRKQTKAPLIEGTNGF